MKHMQKKTISILMTMVLASGIAFAKGIYISTDYIESDNVNTISYATFESIDSTDGVEFGNWLGFEDSKLIDVMLEKIAGDLSDYDDMLYVMNIDYYSSFLFEDVPENVKFVIYTKIVEGELDDRSAFRFYIPKSIDTNTVDGSANVINYYHFVHDTDIETFENTAMNMLIGGKK